MWHSKDKDSVLKELNSSLLNGISQKDVANLVQIYGKNIIQKAKKRVKT